MRRSGVGSGGGHGSKNVVHKPQRLGAPRERIRPSGVGQIGQRQGDHITNQGATGYGGVPLVLAKAYARHSYRFIRETDKQRGLRLRRLSRLMLRIISL